MCTTCGLNRDLPIKPTADSFGVKVVLPTEGSTTLGDLIAHTRTSKLMDDHKCPSCGRCDTTMEHVFVKKLPKYLIVQAPRARHIEDENGQYITDKHKNPIVQKISTSVEFPAKTLDLSPLLWDDQSSENFAYEVFGTVEHRGEG